MNIKITPEAKAKVVSVAKKASGKPLLYASKAIGVVAATAVLYDAHKNGIERSIVKDDIDTANRIHRELKQVRANDSNSATVAKMKEFWFDIQTSFTLDHSVSKALGYIGGFGMTIIKNTPILALSALSLVAKNPTVSKVAGTIVGVYGAKVVCSDVLAIDDKKDLIT